MFDWVVFLWGSDCISVCSIVRRVVCSGAAEVILDYICSMQYVYKGRIICWAAENAGTGLTLPISSRADRDFLASPI